jgi:hypothetical protein
MQPLPDPGALPLIETAVAGRAAAEAELERQMAPRDPGVQHEQNALQGLTIRQTLASWVAKAPLDLRQQRFDPLPQLVRHDPRLRGHWHPSQLDDGCRRPSPSENGSLHFGSSTKAARPCPLTSSRHPLSPTDVYDAACRCAWHRLVLRPSRPVQRSLGARSPPAITAASTSSSRRSLRRSRAMWKAANEARATPSK